VRLGQKALKAAESLDDVRAMLEIIIALYGRLPHSVVASREAQAAQNAFCASRFSTATSDRSRPLWLTGNTMNYGGDQREASRPLKACLT